MIAHQISLQSPQEYIENRDQIQYGSAYYGITYVCSRAVHIVLTMH